MLHVYILARYYRELLFHVFHEMERPSLPGTETFRKQHLGVSGTREEIET